MTVIKWLDDNIEGVIISVVTAVMTVCLFGQVVFRYFEWPLAWTEEVSINLLVWLCYFGSSLAVKHRRHLRIDIVTHFMKPRMRTIFDLISNFCFLIFATFVLWQLGKLTMQIYQWGQITAVLEVPRWIIYFVTLIAWLLTVIRLVQDSLRSLGEYKAGGTAPAEPVVEELLQTVEEVEARNKAREKE